MNTAGRIARSMFCCAAILAVSAQAPRIQTQTDRPAAAAGAVTPMHPVPAQQSTWTLAIEAVALNSDCQPKIQIRNAGATRTTEQHAGSRVSMGGKPAVSLLRVDPTGRLETVGKLVGFAAEQPLTADTDYRVEVIPFNGKTAIRRNPPEPQSSRPQRVEQPAVGSARTLPETDSMTVQRGRQLSTPERIAAARQVLPSAAAAPLKKFKTMPFVSALVDAAVLLEAQSGSGEFAQSVSARKHDQHFDTGEANSTIDWRNDAFFMNKQGLAPRPIAVGPLVTQASHGFR